MNKKTPRTLKDRLAALDSALPGSALIGALMGMGLALPLHATMALTGHMARIPLLCVGIALALAIVHINRWTKWIGGLALAAVVALWLLPWVAQVRNLSAALTLLSSGQSSVLRLYSEPLATLFCAVFTTLGFSLALRSTGFYPALSLTLVVLLGMWFYGARTHIALCLPALLALAMLYGTAAEHGTPLRRILPMALASVLLAFVLLPASNLTAPVLEDSANRLREMIYDYFFYTEPRTSYSLQTDGFQPLSDRLGGPANPEDRPVMEVHTVQPALLRGTVKDTYTGLGWYDAAVGRRYLYIDPRFTALRDGLLDAGRPGKSERAGSALFSAQTVDITMVSPGVSTLFMPQRFATLRPGADMIPYFNASSEVFITRDTAPGDHYSVSAYLFTSETRGAAELVESLRNAGADKHYAEIAERYLNLPAAVETPVHELTAQVIAGQTTPFEKARALARYLSAQFPYTLEQNIPPNSRDFVSWFLLEEKQGYCTSFASALAVMGRIAGLPTRYIEGYAATPDGDGIARVTGLQAHAWVEIYFENFGWMPFDATPSQGPGDDPNGDDPPPEGGGDSSPPPSQPPENGTPEPSDNPPPSPEPTEQPSGESDDNDNNNDDSNDPPTPEPTPTPEPSPTPPPGATPPPPPPDENPPNPPLWWLWLLLLLLIAGTAWRIYVTHPLRAAAKQPGDDGKLLVWYRALAQLLGARGLALDPAESPLAYFERAERALSDAGRNKRRGSSPIPLTPIAGAVCTLRYGAHGVEPSAFRDAETAYRALWQSLTLRQKAAALWQRMLHGVGNIRQVP